MALGGRRPGAGRKKGIPNKKTAALQAEVAASGLTPLDYLLQVMRNPKESADRRLDAAKSAAPFVHPKLSTIQQDIELRSRDVSSEPLTDDEWSRKHTGDHLATAAGTATRPS